MKVTYLGNSVNTTSSSTDGLHIDFTQAYSAPPPSTPFQNDGYFSVTGNFGGVLGTGSELHDTALSSNSGTDSDVLGPFTSDFSAKSTGYRVGEIADLTVYHIRYVLTIGPGTEAGAFIDLGGSNIASVAPPPPPPPAAFTPEPDSAWLLGSGMAFVCLVLYGIRKGRTS